jgi:2,4-dienoyl-CoA reductase-like NADH-dependent reductase (Old Yellow Enzyme family)
MTLLEPRARPLALPGGATLKKRIAKSAMSEQLGTNENAPTPGIARLDETSGKGGAGLLITGNVMIDRRALGEPGNVVLEDERDLEAVLKGLVHAFTHRPCPPAEAKA